MMQISYFRVNLLETMFGHFFLLINQMYLAHDEKVIRPKKSGFLRLLEHEYYFKVHLSFHSIVTL